MTATNTARPTTTVGHVGLGAMGRPIAEFVARAGFDTVAYDLSPDAGARGVRMVDGLAEVATSDVVIVIVPTDDDVVGVVAGPGGLLEHGHRDMIVVISASVRPETCRELAAKGARLGVHVIDAALTGGVRGAENGEINLLVGGPREVADRAGEVFGAFAKNYHVLGDVGAGQVAKSANNLIHWAQIVAIDEALRMAQGLGVEPHALRRALQEGPTDSRTLREMEQMRFTWYVKDIEIATSLAAATGHTLPVATLSRRLMDGVTVAAMHELLAEPRESGEPGERGEEPGPGESR
ncbi:NAD(P)-dependent oxidoreductase [Streptomyces sp. NPDC050560]|uniref:NAD(P)-dependent oxidoreductase n=1 Tax=Streptomyces sp. NPDC050560 TaxID=3365630 RepID=UPI0037B0D69E